MILVLLLFDLLLLVVPSVTVVIHPPCVFNSDDSLGTDNTPPTQIKPAATPSPRLRQTMITLTPLAVATDSHLPTTKEAVLDTLVDAPAVAPSPGHSPIIGGALTTIETVLASDLQLAPGVLFQTML